MRYKDIKGKKFGRLVVVEFSHIKNTRAQWLCFCDCGVEVTCDGGHLREKRGTRSCGCLSKEKASKRLTKYANSKSHKGKGNPAYIHGDTKTKFHKIWSGMMGRCYSKNGGSYKNYGGRGIVVSLKWKNYINFKEDMYESFKKHIEIHGQKQTTIDRIDNNKNYYKANCRWATYKIQASNRRKAKRKV